MVPLDNEEIIEITTSEVEEQLRLLTVTKSRGPEPRTLKKVAHKIPTLFVQVLVINMSTQGYNATLENSKCKCLFEKKGKKE